MDEGTIKDWTILVYMAGDNNLSLDMVYALEQIKNSADQNDNINLLAYFDGYSSNIPTLYCDFTDCQSVNYYRSSKIQDKLIKRSSNTDFNENSASVNNVINFVDWCVNKVEYQKDGKTFNGRKAKNYAMIFSGHSFGFQGEGLFKDEKANYSMNLSRLKWMFERITLPQTELEKLAVLQQNWDEEPWKPEKIKERTTEIIGKPLTILGFDSCVMSMLEVGCQFKDVAKTMVASEGSVPNSGWSYTQILLGKINNDKNATPKEIAASFVESFIRQQNKYALADISVDMAAWDLEKFNELETSFASFVSQLIECFSDKNSIVYKQLKRILIQVHWQAQTYMYQQNIDLGDFCQLLITEINSLKTELQSSIIQPILNLELCCLELIEKIRQCVILTGFSGGKYQYSNGISLFFPWSWSSYLVSQKSYEELSFVRKVDAGKLWNSFLQNYLQDISLRKAKPLSSVNGNGSIVKNPDGSIVYRSFDFIGDSKNTLTEKIPENGANKIPENGIEKIPENGTNKIPENGTNKIPENGTNKIPENGTEKIPENGTNKIPEDGTNKIPENGTSKIPENGTEKIPENGTNKIPENGTNKLVGSQNPFFVGFMETRNIESFWNRSGFISNQVNFVLEDKILNSDGEINTEEISVTNNIAMEITPNINKIGNIVLETKSNTEKNETKLLSPNDDKKKKRKGKNK